jgi:hypothetical protein
MAELPPPPWSRETDEATEMDFIVDANRQVLASFVDGRCLGMVGSLLPALLALPDLIAFARIIAGRSCLCGTGFNPGDTKCLTCQARAALDRADAPWPPAEGKP